MLPLVRHIGQVKEALQNPAIAPITLHTFDSYLESIALALPEPLRPDSASYVDPNFFWVATSPNNARLLLHQHNLSPRCTPEERANALANCASAARGTALLIRRSFQAPPSIPDPYNNPAPPWDQRVRSTASSLLCTHLWRCILLLSLTLDFNAALICLRVSSTIGPLRKINTACGRNLSFFLDRLAERIHASQGRRPQPEADEEMLAYASSDMQADPHNAWIWAADDVTAQEYSPETSSAAQDQPAFSSPTITHPSSAALTDAEAQDWGGWQRVEALLTGLLNEQLQQQQHQQQHGQRHGQQTSLPPVTSDPQTTQFGPGGSDRISIANII